MLNLESFLLIILILFFLYLGWKIKEVYKNIKFYLYKRKGKKAEQKAIKLLKKNGYKNVFQLKGGILNYLKEKKKMKD